MPGNKGGKTKHDRCVEGVKENSPGVSNPHAVCVAAGVEPSSWKKSQEEEKEVLKIDRNGQWSLKKKEHKDQLPGGLADNKEPKDFDTEQLDAGIKVEMEHTNDRAKAKEIAMDHLVEDPNYYKKLKRYVEKNNG